MKNLLLSTLLLSMAIFSLNGQMKQLVSIGSGLEPNDSTALLQVLVITTDSIPSHGDKISFVNIETNESFASKSDKNGRFDILIPKDKIYNIIATVLGKDTMMRTLKVPAQPELITINYTFIYEPPRVIRLDKVYFDTNKSTLRPESFDMLNELVDFLNNKPTIVIGIGGHTDNVGGDEFNKKLSQNRANSVRDFLVKKGIASKRLIPVGYGEERPIATNDTKEGRQTNRRTEIYILEE